MYRIFKDFLESRSPRARRVPLMVRGARQTGKTHIIREYGSANFQNLAEVNLELSPNIISCFASRNPTEICRDLEVLLKTKLIDGKSLLFIDEIQDSEDAIISLRAFKEQRPGLEVIAAGSLLEFVLDDYNLQTFPVGRVDFAWIHPMSFQEFLIALGEDQLVDILRHAEIPYPNTPSQITTILHEKLLRLVREYFVVGGMPEVVDAYRETKSFREAKLIQTRLTLGYIADFVKYGARYDHRKLQSILSAVPRSVGKQFVFSHVDPLVRARDLKQPLFDLEKAGVLRVVRATAANGIPLAAEEKEGTFKVQFLDIGLMLNMLGVDIGTQPIDESFFVNEGALAEQFVGQELLAISSFGSIPQLYFWKRDAKGSEAEVDFVFAKDSFVVPIEVKAGTTGRLKSLHLFIRDKKPPLGIRVSQKPLSLHDGVLSVPFYLCGEIPRLIECYLDKHPVNVKS